MQGICTDLLGYTSTKRVVIKFTLNDKASVDWIQRDLSSRSKNLLFQVKAVIPFLLILMNGVKPRPIMVI